MDRKKSPWKLPKCLACPYLPIAGHTGGNLSLSWCSLFVQIFFYWIPGSSNPPSQWIFIWRTLRLLTITLAVALEIHRLSFSLPWHWGTSLLSVLLLLYGWCHSFSYDPLCVTFPHFWYTCCKRQKSTLAIVKWSSVHHHILLLVKLFGPTSYAPPFHNFNSFTHGFCLPLHCLPPALSWLYSFFQYPDFPIQFLNS